VKPRAGWASSPLQVECWPCGREGPARPSSSRPSSPSHPLANGHQGLLLPSKPYPASGRARGGSGCQPGAWTEPFSKEKDKKLKKKKEINIYKESYKAWLGGWGTAERLLGTHLCQLPAWHPSPHPIFGVAAVPPPCLRWVPFPLLPRASGHGVHPLPPPGAHVDTA
jgi:hypothetical protein